VVAVLDESEQLRVAEVVQLDLQLDAKGKIEAYRAKVKVSFKFEG